MGEKSCNNRLLSHSAIVWRRAQKAEGQKDLFRAP